MHAYFQFILLTSTALTLNSLTASDKTFVSDTSWSNGISSSASHSVSSAYSPETPLKKPLSLCISPASGNIGNDNANVKCLKEKAEKGDADAQIQLAEKYIKGEDVTPNYYEAFYYYDLAAKQKDLRAAYPLGLIYYNGDIVSRNRDEARQKFEWMLNNEKNVDDTHDLAGAKFYLGRIYYKLGEMYYEGEKVDQNYDHARQKFEWILNNEKNVEAPQLAGAKFYLGEMYYQGKGVLQNYDMARSCFEGLLNNLNLIDANHRAGAITYLGEIYYEGKGVPKNYASACGYFKWVIENQYLIDAKYKGIAFTYLGEMFYIGREVSQSYESAVTYFEWVLNNQSSVETKYKGISATYLGEMYYYGNGEVPQNYQNSYAYFEWVINNQYQIDAKYKSIAAAYLGEMYYYGSVGTPQNYQQAFFYFCAAASSGHQVAQYYVGYMALNKRGVGNNIDNQNKYILKGIEYLRCSAANGYLLAQKLLAEQYCFGKDGFSDEYKKAFEEFKETSPYSKETKVLHYRGFPRNYALAFHYFKLAADQHQDNEARHNVGLMYRSGVGVDPDPKEGERYLTWAAGSGYLKTQRFLGNIYFTGTKASCPNLEKAFQYYELAANQGDEEAKYYIRETINACKRKASNGDLISQKLLGKIYFTGTHACPKNHEAALLYYELAVVQHQDLRAKNNILNIVVSIQREADKGNLDSQRLLGKIYWVGTYGYPQNCEKALHYFKLAADQRNDDKAKEYIIKVYEGEAAKGRLGFQKSLGEIYLSGNYGVKQDKGRAFQQYKLAADQHNDAEAKYKVGCMYIEGIGTEKNLDMGIIYLLWASNNGLLKAQTTLGRMYSEGREVAKDDAKAFQQYKLAAQQDDAESQYIVGCMYSQGAGVEKNIDEGKRYFTLAKNSGYPFIQSNVTQH